MSDRKRVINFYFTDEEKAALDRMVADLGMPGRRAVITFLIHAHMNGVLMVMNKAAKESLMGAAEEKMLAKAQKIARETAQYVLWEEGYRADPYDH